jgi:hypothetical protein
MALGLGIPLLAFAAVTAIAELAGAANLGTAMGFGQVAFALVLVALILRPARGRR